MTYELGFLGAGQMAEAIARGILRAGILTPSQMIAADVAAARRGLFEKDMGVKAVEDNKDVAKQAKVLLLAVKPYHVRDVLAGISPVVARDALLISICAGVSTKTMESAIGPGPRVIRSMPNTPMLVGEGAVAIAAGSNATKEDLAIARRYFEAAADVVELPEEQLDAVTALSGSGPAYFFFLVEHLTRAGVEMGLTQEHAHKLATKTALGSARMLMQTTDSPTELRRKVTTPNGTTHAAITHMESAKMGDTIVDALKAAQQRSKEMGS